jgi:hypothetical protein
MSGWCCGSHAQTLPPASLPICPSAPRRGYGICTVCNERMQVVEAGQTTQPCCDNNLGTADDLERAVRLVLEIFGSEALDKCLVQRRRRDESDSSYPVLHRDSDICRDCGNPYGFDALTTRCFRRH